MKNLSAKLFLAGLFAITIGSNVIAMDETDDLLDAGDLGSNFLGLKKLKTGRATILNQLKKEVLCPTRKAAPVGKPKPGHQPANKSVVPAQDPVDAFKKAAEQALKQPRERATAEQAKKLVAQKLEEDRVAETNRLNKIAAEHKAAELAAKQKLEKEKEEAEKAAQEEAAKLETKRVAEVKNNSGLTIGVSEPAQTELKNARGERTLWDRCWDNKKTCAGGVVLVGITGTYMVFGRKQQSG